MKRYIILLMIPAAFLLASSKKNFGGCVEQKLNERTSLYSCPQALLEVTFNIKRTGNGYVREQDESPTIKILSETKAQIIKVNEKR
ncbi:MAG: hypothetical protein ACNI25_09800 [Halarcobacter sp.]